MSASIFISFASQDSKVAMTLCSALESRGFRCWISARDILPGENFQIAIVRAIRQAKIMLLVFTANSNNSQEMNKELALASQNKLIVVPLRVEDVAPNDAFAYEFATRQWIDCFSDWETAMQQLAGRIGAAIKEDADPPVPALAAAPLVSEPAAAEIKAPAPKETAPKKKSPAPEAKAVPPPRKPDAPANDPVSGEAPAAPKRMKLYLGLSAAALLALVVAGLAGPALRRPPAPAPHAPERATLPIQPPHATGLQTASVVVPALAAAPEPEAADSAAPAPAAAPEKPAPIKRKKKAVAARKADDYVPF